MKPTLRTLFARAHRYNLSISDHLLPTRTTTMTRDYAAAIAALNTLQSNFAVREAMRKSGNQQAINAQAIPEMLEWCRRAGYEPAAFDKLNCIHVAGTKGKGSTSSFISSILAQYLPSGSKEDAFTTTTAAPITNIGLFTSPHLRFVRERIQFNNTFISEEKFSKYFFEIWDRLEAAQAASPVPANTPPKPMYFRYLTLMALHAYLSESVDTAVIECGIGGEYDSTNILVRPAVTAITSLGIDHTPILGPTIEEIAWHKAGIMKSGAVAFTAPQPESALEVLRKRAAEKGVQLHVVSPHPNLANVKLGLEGTVQKLNASLAIAVAAAHLRNLGYTEIEDPTSTSSIALPPQFIRGLETVKLGGRCEIRREEDISWFLDGGHTTESITLTGEWFASHLSPQPTSDPYPTPAQLAAQPAQQKRILIFNQAASDRSAISLAETLHQTVRNYPFSHVLFTTSTPFPPDSPYCPPDLHKADEDKTAVASLGLQNKLAEVWRGLDSKADVKVAATIEEAVGVVRELAEDGPVKVLITGSLHLVGGMIDVLETHAEARKS